MTTDSSLHARDSTWRVERRGGHAGDLHALDFEEGRSIILMEPVAPAIVLGSTQSESVVDARSALDSGVEVCQRRSGGGVVFVHPRHSVWVDVLIPRDDPHWIDDVTRSSLWLGDAIVEALSACGVTDLRTYTGPMERGEFGAMVCFASAAPGEVFGSTSTTAEKVVGISQRRGRYGARYQCILYRKWAPQEWTHHLTDEAVQTAANQLVVRDVDVSADDVVENLRRALGNR